MTARAGKGRRLHPDRLKADNSWPNSSAWARRPPWREVDPRDVSALKASAYRSIVSGRHGQQIPRYLARARWCLPDQIIDYAARRQGQLLRGRTAVTHIDFTLPYDEAVHQRLARRWPGPAAAWSSATCAGAGRRWSTRPRSCAWSANSSTWSDQRHARSRRWRATSTCTALAVVADHAAGKGDSRTAISLEAIDATLRQAMDARRRIPGALRCTHRRPDVAHQGLRSLSRARVHLSARRTRGFQSGSLARGVGERRPVDGTSSCDPFAEDGDPCGVQVDPARRARARCRRDHPVRSFAVTEKVRAGRARRAAGPPSAGIGK